MRFKNIESFSIDGLLLDEGNYRFQHADNQEDCIKKIYDRNPKYFSNLMSSLANDDMGEPLLVFRNPKTKVDVVLDGNRRTAALKVLHDLDKAPSPALKVKAADLTKSSSFNFEDIQAQVSEDRELILTTVYERHAAGEGKSQVDWTALANAKFRFDTKLHDDQDWYEIALLMALEDDDMAAVEFVYQSGYSHEVFRRIIRGAVQKEIIPESLFSTANMRINKGQKTKLNKALKLVRKFLFHMEEGKISLSRNKGNYADKKYIDEYLSQFEEKPPATGGTENNGTGNDTSKANVGRDNEAEGNPATDSGDNGESGEEDGRTGEDIKLNVDLDTKTPRKLPQSNQIVQKLNKLCSIKLSRIYYSLTSISLNNHPALSWIAAWVFLETISNSLSNKDEPDSFNSHLASKVNDWFTAPSEKKEIKKSLNAINNEGNSNKHHKDFMSLDAKPLIMHFKILEPLLVKALDALITKTKD